jgi:hypothetical protein
VSRASSFAAVQVHVKTKSEKPSVPETFSREGDLQHFQSVARDMLPTVHMTREATGCVLIDIPSPDEDAVTCAVQAIKRLGETHGCCWASAPPSVKVTLRL